MKTLFQLYGCKVLTLYKAQFMSHTFPIIIEWHHGIVNINNLHKFHSMICLIQRLSARYDMLDVVSILWDKIVLACPLIFSLWHNVYHDVYATWTRKLPRQLYPIHGQLHTIPPKNTHWTRTTTHIPPDNYHQATNPLKINPKYLQCIIRNECAIVRGKVVQLVIVPGANVRAKIPRIHGHDPRK